MKIRDPISK
jgi:hypothetical protein